MTESTHHTPEQAKAEKAAELQKPKEIVEAYASRFMADAQTLDTIADQLYVTSPAEDIVFERSETLREAHRHLQIAMDADPFSRPMIAARVVQGLQQFAEVTYRIETSSDPLMADKLEHSATEMAAKLMTEQQEHDALVEKAPDEAKPIMKSGMEARRHTVDLVGAELSANLRRIKGNEVEARDTVEAIASVLQMHDLDQNVLAQVYDRFNTLVDTIRRSDTERAAVRLGTSQLREVVAGLYVIATELQKQAEAQK